MTATCSTMWLFTLWAASSVSPKNLYRKSGQDTLASTTWPLGGIPESFLKLCQAFVTWYWWLTTHKALAGSNPQEQDSRHWTVCSFCRYQLFAFLSARCHAKKPHTFVFSTTLLTKLWPESHPKRLPPPVWLGTGYTGPIASSPSTDNWMEAEASWGDCIAPSTEPWT